MMTTRFVLPLLIMTACTGTLPAEGEGEASEGEGEEGEGEGEGEEGEGEEGEGEEGEGEEGEGEEGEGEEGEGEEGEGEGCVTSEDCAAFNFCGHLSQESTAGCDFFEIEQDDCDNNDDCPANGVCDAVPLGCSQAERQCVSACSTPGDCAADEDCVAGRCESVSCTGRYDCPAGAECTVLGPLNPFANPFDTYGKHGCEFVACDAAEDCPNEDATCISGLCQEGPGLCLTMGG